jgi:hypothetical protein
MSAQASMRKSKIQRTSNHLDPAMASINRLTSADVRETLAVEVIPVAPDRERGTDGLKVYKECFTIV